MLLGSLAVIRDGRPLPPQAWRSRQECRLLCMLITARGARIPVERLIEALWPEADRWAAAITLRSAISSLRHTLEPEAAARASSHYIVTRQGGYAWNAESDAWIDVDEFLALTDDDRRPPLSTSRRARLNSLKGAADAGQRPASGEARLQDPTHAAGLEEQRSEGSRIQRLQRAIALYRGDYLEDEADAPWLTRTREMLRERFLNALSELAELWLAAGEPDAAIVLARRGLEVDRLREPLYRVLMRAQARAGDVAGALQSYERYRWTLDEELGAEPSAQTRALHGAILRGEESAVPERGAEREGAIDAGERAPTLASLPTSASPLPRSTAPFVGRAQELAMLRAWIADLDRRQGGIVAVVGEAGIGKTRLIAEVLRAAVGRGISVITLRCASLDHGLPFAPLREALRPLLRAAPEELLRRLPIAAMAQVADLLPVLRERLPDLPVLASAPPLERNTHLLDGIVDLALALARDRPLVIWCDDAHWADESTLIALGRLARHAPRRALLLILAYRSEELVENVALHGLLRALGREMLLRPLLLGRFDAAEVAQFLAGLAHAPPDRVAPLAPRLMASSGGNPLFLSVAVQSLLEARGVATLAALLPDLGSIDPLPNLAAAPPLRDLVLARYERLPLAARVLLEQLAVIGRPVSLDLIEELGGAAALDAAQMLLERQFLVESVEGRIAFGHDLVRSIVATTLSSPQRRRLHQQVATAIATLRADQPEYAAELAFHFGQAGHEAETEALHYATAAGDHARSSFGYREALGHYDAALQAAERLGARIAPAEVRRVFAGRLAAYEALLDWDGIMDTSTRYERWVARRGLALPPLVTSRRLVLLRALIGDLAGAATISAEQAHHQPNAAPAIHDMLWRTATILHPVDAEVGDWSLEVEQTAIADLQSHIPFTPAPPLPGAPARDMPAILGHEESAMTLFQIGWAALMQGLLRDAEPCLLRAYELAIETSQVSAAVISALQLAHLNALRGDASATHDWLGRSLDLAQRAPEAAWASIWPQIHQAFLLLLDDQPVAARQRFDLMAAQLRDRAAFQSHRASIEVGQGLLELANSDLAAALDRLNRALSSPQLLYGFVYVAAQHGLARIAAIRGDLARARAILSHALSYSAQRSLLPEYVRTAIEIGRIERDFGEPAVALALLGDATVLARNGGLAALAEAATALLNRLQS